MYDLSRKFYEKLSVGVTWDFNCQIDCFHNLTGARGLGQGQANRRPSAGIPGHGTGQWLPMTHRFRGIFRRLGQRNFPSSAAAMVSNFPQTNGRSLCLALPILSTDHGAGQRARPKPRSEQ